MGKYKHEGIYPLLYHSDCDGNLTVEECERIVPIKQNYF